MNSYEVGHKGCNMRYKDPKLGYKLCYRGFVDLGTLQPSPILQPTIDDIHSPSPCICIYVLFCQISYVFRIYLYKVMHDLNNQLYYALVLFASPQFLFQRAGPSSSRTSLSI